MIIPNQPKESQFQRFNGALDDELIWILLDNVVNNFICRDISLSYNFHHKYTKIFCV